MSAIPDDPAEAKFLFEVIHELERRLCLTAVPTVRASHWASVYHGLKHVWEIVDPDRFVLFLFLDERRVRLELFETCAKLVNVAAGEAISVKDIPVWRKKWYVPRGDIVDVCCAVESYINVCFSS